MQLLLEVLVLAAARLMANCENDDFLVWPVEAIVHKIKVLSSY